MRDTFTSPRVEDMKRRRRVYRTRLSVLLSILFILVVGSLAYFSAHPRATIRYVIVSGTHIINPEDVEQSVRADMTGRYIRLFKKSNSFIYPKGKIYSDLLAQFPRIESLSIYRDNLTTLHIAISERSGSYLYCGASIPETSTDIGENCYFINSDGYIFDKAPYFSGNVYFKYYMSIPDITSTDPLGSQMLPKESFHALARFIDGVTSIGFKPIDLVIDEDGEGSLYLNHLDGATSPKIIFKSSSDLETLFNNLSLSMKKPEFASEINTKYSKLLYIDLRFNNKVVYKFEE